VIKTIADINAASLATWPLHGKKDVVEGYYWELMCSWLELVVPWNEIVSLLKWLMIGKMVAAMWISGGAWRTRIFFWRSYATPLWGDPECHREPHVSQKGHHLLQPCAGYEKWGSNMDMDFIFIFSLFRICWSWGSVVILCDHAHPLFRTPPHHHFLLCHTAWHSLT
jgi:hypothetical protein